MPGSLHAPIANAEDDGASCLCDGIAKFGILNLGVESFGVTPVNLYVVYAPLGICFYVLNFVFVAARALLASHPAGVGVDAEFQTFIMDILGERFDARREALGIRDDGAVGVAADLPAIVNVHEFEAGGLHATGDHCVRRFLNKLFRNIAGEFVPAVPPHRRSLGQGCSFGRLGGGGEGSGGEDQ